MADPPLFVGKKCSTDIKTPDKLLRQKNPLNTEEYNLPSGDEVCQVKRKRSSVYFVELVKCVGNIESSSVLGFYHGLLDVLYCDNDTSSGSIQEGESGIRQPEKIFTTSSTSVHKDSSLSESETIVRQFILRWRQVVRQLEESTSSHSAHKDRFSSELALSSYLEYVLRKMVDHLNASNIQKDEDGQNMLEEVNPVIAQGGIPPEPPWNHSLKKKNPKIEDLLRKLKEMKDQYVIERLDTSHQIDIPHKTLKNYSQKQSYSVTGVHKLVSTFVLNDSKDTLENHSLKSMRNIIVNLLGDYTRKYGNLFKEARSRVSQVRKHTDLWHGNVLASRDKELFPEGSFAGNVQKLMKKDLNRLGAGGNGEIVEAFYQRKHLVIKKTLLRELELSVVPKLEHKNLLPWFAIISGEKSERRPGQVSCYQIMQKMTEDLSASIRTIGGSIHDHILSLQQDSVPKAEVSQQAELMRRNTSVVFRNVLEGLQYLHEQGLIHRDIKASNILLKKPESCAHTSIFTCDCTPHWEVKVADFDSIGQISVLRERTAMRGKELKSGHGPFLKVSATGTSGYRAPEIFEEFTSSDVNDPQYFSPASDIWALGGVGIHVVMGFCTPRKQYQFGLMMLAHRGMLKGDERDDIISRTLGLHHIREGFPGEKWKDMINFVSRPLQIDWYQRPSAKKLLQDPFIQRYNTTPGLNTVVNETATLDTATPSTIELSTEPQQVENQFINRNDISGPNRPRTGNL